MDAKVCAFQKNHAVFYHIKINLYNCPNNIPHHIIYML
ncbi:hypothetical protein EC2864350_2147 [Escherichia coli 2864350]|nr:hypothetical protein EC2864350_2147 [Escherichia coli 2864350]